MTVRLFWKIFFVMLFNGTIVSNSRNLLLCITWIKRYTKVFVSPIKRQFWHFFVLFVYLFSKFSKFLFQLTHFLLVFCGRLSTGCQKNSEFVLVFVITRSLSRLKSFAKWQEDSRISTDPKMLSAKLMNSWKSVRITLFSSKDILPVFAMFDDYASFSDFILKLAVKNKPVPLF